MPDPRLVSRAQRAATMLELAWDRWRAAHGLPAEPLPPVSSYVGYSIEEPWGRPRVVFGVDAGDAEKLATLLQECAASSQPSMDEVRARIPAQGRTAERTGSREPRSGADQAAGSANGPHTAPHHVPDSDTADFAVHSDGGHDSAAAAPDEDLADPDDRVTPDHPADEDRELSADADSQENPGGDIAEPHAPDSGDNSQAGSDEGEAPSQTGSDEGEARSQADSDEGDHGDSGHGVADTMAAELAGWVAGELPGQASARLAAWAKAGGATARTSLDAELRTADGTAEPAI
jgi:hypothetical protein